MKIGLGQTKPVTGDIQGNTQQIIDMLKQATADVVVFPETAITGYCCGALFEQVEFIKENIVALHEKIIPAVQGVAVVGFVNYHGKKQDGSLHLTNSAAVIQNGVLVGIYDKVLLANDGHHEDKKYFSAGRQVRVFDVEINGKQVVLGTPICEDVWHKDHQRDIVKEMVDLGATLICSPNFSYFYARKQQLRYDIFGSHATKYDVPVIMVNASGVGDIVKDILIYDGGSFVYTKKGLLMQSKRFDKEYVECSLDKEPIAKEYSSLYEELVDALVFEQREFFSALGILNAQVHLSGGLDSSIIAAIVYEAMGKENTIFISNPTEHNGEVTKNNVTKLVEALGTKVYWNTTQLPYKAAMQSFEIAFRTTPTPQEQTPLEAVMRTAQGISASHHFKSGIVATPNHTEIVLGWTTFHDIGSIGVHAPIGDLTKQECYELAAYLNERAGKIIIPRNLYDGTLKPAAELADAHEDPIDYTAMSVICAELIRNRSSPQTIVEKFVKKKLDFIVTTDFYNQYTVKQFNNLVKKAFALAKHSVYKAAQSAPIVLLNQRGRGFSNRETLINKWDGDLHE
jgi:NAD+ synthase (glutamine-hydrolysing)